MSALDLWSPTQSPQTMPDDPIGGVGESAEWYRIKLLTPGAVAVAKAYQDERNRQWAELLESNRTTDITEKDLAVALRKAMVPEHSGPGESFEAYKAKLAHGKIQAMLADMADKFDIPEMVFGHDPKDYK